MRSPDETRDRFVDALLEQRFRDTPLEMERRVTRVIRAVSTRTGSHWGWWALPLAALVTISLLVVPQESSADALVKTAMRAAAKPGDRRYRVVFTPVPLAGHDAAPGSEATLDVRDASHVRCEVRRPNGDLSVRGRAGDVSWEVHPNGDAVILDREPHWPRWIETPDGSLLVDSMAGVLEGLRDGYVLTTVDGKAVRATRTVPGRRGDPSVIDLCLDGTSGEVTRLEMQFAKLRDPGEEIGPPPRRPSDHRGPDERPPLSIVFTKIDCDGFPAGWFDPPADARQVAPPRD